MCFRSHFWSALNFHDSCVTRPVLVGLFVFHNILTFFKNYEHKIFASKTGRVGRPDSMTEHSCERGCFQCVILSCVRTRHWYGFSFGNSETGRGGAETEEGQSVLGMSAPPGSLSCPCRPVPNQFRLLSPSVQRLVGARHVGDGRLHSR